MFIHDLTILGNIKKSSVSRFIHDLATLENSKRVYQQVHTLSDDNLNILDKIGDLSQENYPIKDFGNSCQWKSPNDNFIGSTRANRIKKLSVGSNKNWTYTISVGYNQLQMDWCQLQRDFKGSCDDQT